VTGRWFSPGTPVSSTNKTDSDYIAEILLKVGLNTINIHTHIDERKWKISKFTKNPHQKNQMKVLISYKLAIHEVCHPLQMNF
jgi:hypothetical protein